MGDKCAVCSRSVFSVPALAHHASGWCVLSRFPVHALTLPLVHVQQDVQFVQTGGLCFQLVLLRKWLLYLELCTGKLGLISGEVVLLGNEIALN